MLPLTCLVFCLDLIPGALFAVVDPEVFYQNNNHVQKPTPTMHYEHKVKLDGTGHFWLFWTTNDTHITFESHVKTKGYIGFGLSPNGKMYLIVGWVDAAGQAHLHVSFRHIFF